MHYYINILYKYYILYIIYYILYILMDNTLFNEPVLITPLELYLQLVDDKVKLNFVKMFPNEESSNKDYLILQKILKDIIHIALKLILNKMNNINNKKYCIIGINALTMFISESMLEQTFIYHFLINDKNFINILCDALHTWFGNDSNIFIDDYNKENYRSIKDFRFYLYCILVKYGLVEENDTSIKDYYVNVEYTKLFYKIDMDGKLGIGICLVLSSGKLCDDLQLNTKYTNCILQEPDAERIQFSHFIMLDICTFTVQDTQLFPLNLIEYSFKYHNISYSKFDLCCMLLLNKINTPLDDSLRLLSLLCNQDNFKLNCLFLTNFIFDADDELTTLYNTILDETIQIINAGITYETTKLHILLKLASYIKKYILLPVDKRKILLYYRINTSIEYISDEDIDEMFNVDSISTNKEVIKQFILNIIYKISIIIFNYDNLHPNKPIFHYTKSSAEINTILKHSHYTNTIIPQSIKEQIDYIDNGISQFHSCNIVKVCNFKNYIFLYRIAHMTYGKLEEGKIFSFTTLQLNDIIQIPEYVSTSYSKSYNFSPFINTGCYIFRFYIKSTDPYWILIGNYSEFPTSDREILLKRDLYYKVADIGYTTVAIEKKTVTSSIDTEYIELPIITFVPFIQLSHAMTATIQKGDIEQPYLLQKQRPNSQSINDCLTTITPISKKYNIFNNIKGGNKENKKYRIFNLQDNTEIDNDEYEISKEIIIFGSDNSLNNNITEKKLDTLNLQIDKLNINNLNSLNNLNEITFTQLPKKDSILPTSPSNIEKQIYYNKYLKYKIKYLKLINTTK